MIFYIRFIITSFQATANFNSR